MSIRMTAVQDGPEGRVLFTRNMTEIPRRGERVRCAEVGIDTQWSVVDVEWTYCAHDSEVYVYLSRVRRQDRSP